jgi:putative PIN family toxin of toxin-antitoxin system
MKRPRVLIDTNVLVSGILFGGVPGQVVEAARDRRIRGVVSLHILGEMRDVLTRPRFGVDPGDADLLAEEIAEFCEVVPVELSQAAWSCDPDDDPVVEAALHARVDVVVTGDGHLLRLDSPDVHFLAPSAFLEMLAQERLR